jgi:hypothetical protein
MPKIDLKKELKKLYLPSAKEVTIVDVPPMNFLMIDGEGDPDKSQDFKDAIEALFSMSYTLKFIVKKNKPSKDYVVMPLEGLWWIDNMLDFDIQDKDKWQWTVMIVQPDTVTMELYLKATKEAGARRDLPALGRMRFEKFHEGLAAQIMHIGPFSAERQTIKIIHDFMTQNGFEREGKHHEIYMSDPRRTAQEKLKTVIRQPMKKG